jgi:hypothetical protein
VDFCSSSTAQDSVTFRIASQEHAVSLISEYLSYASVSRAYTYIGHAASLNHMHTRIVCEDIRTLVPRTQQYTHPLIWALEP